LFGSKRKYLLVGAVGDADGNAPTGNLETRISPPKQMPELRSISTSATIELVMPGDDPTLLIVFFPVFQEGELVGGNSDRVTMAAGNAEGPDTYWHGPRRGKSEQQRPSRRRHSDSRYRVGEWACSHGNCMPLKPIHRRPSIPRTGEACRAAGIPTNI
jgi:hypothetical protein